MIITYSSMKGGVGKTTDAILTATNLAVRGFKVLFFDLDTNNSGTMYFSQGIENIQDMIETHNVFESLSHNESKLPPAEPVSLVRHKWLATNCGKPRSNASHRNF